MIVIRDMYEKDVLDSLSIANEAFSDEIQRGMLSFTEEYFLNRINKDGVKLVVAELKHVIGFMLITDSNVFVPAQLHLIAVNKKERGHGVGKKLVQFAIDYTELNEWKKLKLSTRPWNEAMRKVCTDLGFTEEALLRLEYLGEDLIQYGYFP